MNAAEFILSIARWPRATLIIFLLAAGLLVAYLDVRTDERFSLALLFGPFVAIAAWRFDVIGVLVSALTAALLPLLLTWADGGVWMSADVVAGAIRLLIFGIFGAALLRLKSNMRSQRRLAENDALTGLGNRRQLFAQGQSELQRARAGGENFAALFIDCDHFKAINDVWGHPRGDELLREVADSMRQVFDQTYLMARLGGDEFVVLKRGVDVPSLQNRAFELQSTFARRMVEHDCQLTLSIGAAVFDQPPANLDGVIAVADELMYRVKRQGRNHVEFRKVTTTERFQAPHKRS